MSKRSRQHTGEAPASSRKKLPVVAFLATIMGALVALGLWNNRPPDEAAPSVAKPAKQDGVEPPAETSATKVKPSLQKLVGRWVRPDGGYVIQFEGVDEGGTLDAAYFNPNPIPVERAEAKFEGNELQVVVVLGGENYNGSTYTLTYDSTADRLSGIYYQAVAGQQFEVFFERMN